MSTRISSWLRVIDDSDECEAAAKSAPNDTCQFGTPLSFIDHSFIVDMPENRSELISGDET
jgi:hypothetical protein